MNSFHRLDHVGTSPHLAPLVRNLECHSWGIWEGDIEDFELFLYNARWIVNHDPRYEEYHMLGDDDEYRMFGDDDGKLIEFYARYYSSYLDEVQAQKDFGECKVVETLGKSLTPFLRLKNFTWHETHGNIHDWEQTSIADDHHPHRLPQSSSVALRTGMRRLEQIRVFEYEDFISVLKDCNITKFSAPALSWVQFYREISLMSLSPIVKSVRNLHIGFDLTYFNKSVLNSVELNRNPINALQLILREAKDVSDLRIGLHHVREGLRFSDTMFDKIEALGISETISRCCFHSLKHLTLQNLVLTGNQLIDFVKSQKTIKSLTIDGLYLRNKNFMDFPSNDQAESISIGPYDYIPSTVIEIIYKLRTKCEIQDFHIQGVITDGMGQGWYATPSENLTCFRRKLEDFVCRKGSSPFSATHKFYRMPTESYDSQWFADLQYVIINLGDWSFQYDRFLAWDFELGREANEIVINNTGYDYDDEIENENIAVRLEHVEQYDNWFILPDSRKRSNSI